MHMYFYTSELGVVGVDLWREIVISSPFIHRWFTLDWHMDGRFRRIDGSFGRF